MAPFRIERANSFIKEELTLLLRNKVSDRQASALTITEVSLTSDRRIARVYVASYEGEQALRDGIEGLERAKGFLRSQLGKNLHWNFLPDLEFRIDRSWEQGARIDALLEQIAQDPPNQVDDTTESEPDDRTS